MDNTANKAAGVLNGHYDGFRFLSAEKENKRGGCSMFIKKQDISVCFVIREYDGQELWHKTLYETEWEMNLRPEIVDKCYRIFVLKNLTTAHEIAFNG